MYVRIRLFEPRNEQGRCGTRKDRCDSELSDLVLIASVTALRSLDLDGNAGARPRAACGPHGLGDLGESLIDDLAPLAGLTALLTLCLSEMAASDLAPLGGLQTLEDVYVQDERARRRWNRRSAGAASIQWIHKAGHIHAGTPAAVSCVVTVSVLRLLPTRLFLGVALVARVVENGDLAPLPASSRGEVG